jgi:hypothetical protein
MPLSLVIRAGMVWEYSVPGHPRPACVGRLDYIFDEEPQSSHDYVLDLARIRSERSSTARQYRRPDIPV